MKYEKIFQVYWREGAGYILSKGLLSHILTSDKVWVGPLSSRVPLRGWFSKFTSGEYLGDSKTLRGAKDLVEEYYREVLQ